MNLSFAFVSPHTGSASGEPLSRCLGQAEGGRVPGPCRCLESNHLPCPPRPCRWPQLLARHTREGELYEKLENGRVRCFACGHRCLDPARAARASAASASTKAESCKVPFGYVAALHVDPVEKKPFFHALPGARALSFGMLGCDFHCGYCFPGDTIVATDAGPATLAQLHESCTRKEERAGAELAYPESLQVVAGSGALRRVRGVVRHRYEGDLVRIQAHYLPPVRCTPDHRVYASRVPDEPPHPVLARDLTVGHHLAIPRHAAAGSRRGSTPSRQLASHRLTRRIRWDLLADERELVAAASTAGESSRSIGLTLGKSASYVRHVRTKIARGLGSDWRTHGLVVEGNAVRFAGEHAPGIPALDRGRRGSRCTSRLLLRRGLRGQGREATQQLRSQLQLRAAGSGPRGAGEDAADDLPGGRGAPRRARHDARCRGRQEPPRRFSSRRWPAGAAPKSACRP